MHPLKARFAKTPTNSRAAETPELEPTIADMNARDARAAIGNIVTWTELQRARAAEEARPGGPRKTVIAAIEAEENLYE